MKYLALTAAGACLLAMSAAAGVNPSLAEGVQDNQAPIVLAQAETKKSKKTVTEKVKDEAKAVKKKVKAEAKEVKQKVKKAWRKMSGYKFAVACPALIPVTHSTCTETGKNRADARAKCQAASPLCSVTEAKK